MTRTIRGKSEGSIFKRKNGSWRAQIYLEGRRLSFTGHTQAECRLWLQETQQRVRTGLTYAGTQVTVAEYLENWLDTVRANLRDGTWRQYHQILVDYVNPELGLLKLVEVRPEQIQHLYNQLIKQGKSRRLVQLVHSVVRRSFNQAVKLGLLAQNPALATMPPKPHYKEMQILNQEQVQRLLIAAEAKGHKYLVFYSVALTTGMRQGELLGLKWEDLDFQHKSLKVARQAQPKPGGGFQFLQPKTRAGKRTIKVGEAIVAVLGQHYTNQLDQRARLGDAWCDLGLVFPSNRGTPQNPPNVARSFRSLLASAGLPRIRFHDLRHTAASLMLNNGVDVLVVSRRLGHSKASITLDIYGHVIPSSQERVADLMEELIAPRSVEKLHPTAPQLHHEHSADPVHPQVWK